MTDATVGLLSYVVHGADAARPICFAFNGGPGASSAFLNVGALGPRRVAFAQGGALQRAPVALADNPFTLLHDCDLVFVDPPGTGFARLEAATAQSAYNVDGDAELLLDALRQWLDRHGRWSSPVYLCGESYGAARAAVLADAALDHGIAIAGVLLVSPAIDMQPVLCVAGNDAAYGLRIPAYAATAFHHGCVADGEASSAEDAYRRAERWLAEFRGLQGVDVDGTACAALRAEAAARLSGLIGLPASFILDRGFLIDPEEFSRELLRHRRLVVGKMDSRALGFASRGPSAQEDDVAIDAVYASIATAMRVVLREELKVDWPASYEVFSHAAYGAWHWNRGGTNGNQFSSTCGDLARALRRNPALRVWACSGRYDLVTPTTSVDWSLARLDIAPDARSAIRHDVLESGHMAYTCDGAHRRMMAAMHDWFALAGEAEEST